jgi:hypothetical protein
VLANKLLTSGGNQTRTYEHGGRTPPQAETQEIPTIKYLLSGISPGVPYFVNTGSVFRIRKRVQSAPMQNTD